MISSIHKTISKWIKSVDHRSRRFQPALVPDHGVHQRGLIGRIGV
jgi:hypothetical protein